jgi:hypothetical protein
MSNERRPTQNIRIAVSLSSELHESLDDAATASIQQELTRFAAGVAEDLELPAIEVMIGYLSDENVDPDAGRAEKACDYCGSKISHFCGGSGFAVTIQGERCRLPMMQPVRLSSESGKLAAAPDVAAALVERVAWVVHANRELLVDARVAEDLRGASQSGAAGEYPLGLSRTAFADYLRLLVHGCFRVGRGRLPARPNAEALLGEAAPQPLWTAEESFEQAAHLIDNLNCTLYRSIAARTPEEETINQAVERQREYLWFELGVRVPEVKLKSDEALRPSEFRLRVNDLHLPAKAGLAENEFLVNERPAHLELLGLKARPAWNPATWADAAIVSGASGLGQASARGLTTWNQDEYTLLACSSELRRHAHLFVVGQAVQRDLDLLRNLRAETPEAAQRRFKLPTITRALRSLAREGIPARDLLGVLNAMLSINYTLETDFGKRLVFLPYGITACPAAIGADLPSLSAEALAECVRMCFRQAICSKYARGQTLTAYLLDEALESRVASFQGQPLPADERTKIVRALAKQLRFRSPGQPPPVVVTTVEVRRAFREMIEIEFPELPVVSHQELLPHLNIQRLARIALE